MNTYILYGITIILLLISLFKDKKKTKISLIKAWKSFSNILPEFLVIILLVGVLLVVLFEISSLGAKFAITRLLIDIPGIIIIAYALSAFISKEDVKKLYENAEMVAK